MPASAGASRTADDEAGGQQGMAAEVGEEVALQRDRLVAEDQLGRGDQGRLGLVGGGLLLAVSRPRP